jgi:hypothetical protein
LIIHSEVDEDLKKWAGVSTCEVCTLDECRPCTDEENETMMMADTKAEGTF